MFIRCTEDLAGLITVEGSYSLEFTSQKGFSYMAVRFWREDAIQRVELCRHPLTSAYPGNFFGSISRLLSFIFAGPNLVSVSGCSQPYYRLLTRVIYLNTPSNTPSDLRSYRCRVSCIRSLTAFSGRSTSSPSRSI